MTEARRLLERTRLHLNATIADADRQKVGLPNVRLALDDIDAYLAQPSREGELVAALEELVPLCGWCGGKGTTPNEIAGISEREQCRYCGPAQRVLAALAQEKEA